MCARACAYCARTSVHRGLVKLLSHGKGDVGGAHGCGGFDGQGLPILRDLHQRLGRRLHCDHAHHHVHAFNRTGERGDREQTFQGGSLRETGEIRSVLNHSTLEQSAGCSLSSVQPRCQRKQLGHMTSTHICPQLHPDAPATQSAFLFSS